MTVVNSPVTSVTIFVRREMGVFHAKTAQASAIDIDSATQACRRCCAEHFGVTESEIEVVPQTANVMISRIKTAETPHAVASDEGRYDLLWAVLLTIIGT